MTITLLTNITRDVLPGFFVPAVSNKHNVSQFLPHSGKSLPYKMPPSSTARIKNPPCVVSFSAGRRGLRMKRFRFMIVLSTYLCELKPVTVRLTVLLSALRPCAVWRHVSRLCAWLFSCDVFLPVARFLPARALFFPVHALRRCHLMRSLRRPSGS